MAKKSTEVNIVLDQEKPEPTEIIAASIIKISAGFDKLMKGGLNRRALVVLIKDHTNVPQYAIEKVLDCLPRLQELYCHKRMAKPNR